MDTSDRSKDRVPLSVTIRADLLPFVQRCVASNEMGSVDEFFDTAVEALRMQMDALLAYMAEQSGKGCAEEDLERAVKCRITYHPLDH